MKHTEMAQAKINLYLNVTAKRNDGFHDIESVMQTVDLCDVLHFSLSPAKETKISLSFSTPCDLPTDEKNLIVRAAKAFLEAAGKTAELSILLEKNIPMAAGLGGGSADAAGTLRALDAMLPGTLSKAALLELAAALGSDVPFCLLGGRALCYGRGEEMVALPVKESYFGVLANTDEAVSTPKAYGKLDEMYHDFEKSNLLPRDLSDRDMLKPVLNGEMPPSYNIFEDAVLPLCPKAKKAKMLLSEMGAEISMMSGSGPSVFALTKDFALSQKMQETLFSHGYKAVLFSF